MGCLPCGAADQRLVQPDLDLAQLGEQLRAAGVRGPRQEAALLLDVHHDRTAVALGEPDGVHDDREQHVVEDETGADRFADLVEGLQLFDLAGQLDPAALEGPHQMHVADRGGGLGGERPQQPDRLVVEGLDPCTPQADRAHHSSSRISGAAITVRYPPGPARPAGVIGIAEHIDDLLDGAILRHPARQRGAIEPQRMLVHVGPEIGRETDRSREGELAHRTGDRPCTPWARHSRRALSATVPSTASGSAEERPRAISTSFAAASCSMTTSRSRRRTARSSTLGSRAASGHPLAFPPAGAECGATATFCSRRRGRGNDVDRPMPPIRTATVSQAHGQGR